MAAVLHYLDFDYSEASDGNATWDAMASVTAAQWSALLAETAADGRASLPGSTATPVQQAQTATI